MMKSCGLSQGDKQKKRRRELVSYRVSLGHLPMSNSTPLIPSPGICNDTFYLFSLLDPFFPFSFLVAGFVSSKMSGKQKLQKEEIPGGVAVA